MILFMDSFDNYATADIGELWTQLYDYGGSGSNVTIAAVGRRGTNGVKFATTSVATDPYAMAVVLDTTETTAIIGFAFTITGTMSGIKVNGGGSSAGIAPYTSTGSSTPSVVNSICSIRWADYTQVGFRLNKNGTVTAVLGNGVVGGLTEDVYTELGTTSNAFQVNQTYYVEIKVLIHASAGTVTFRVDNTDWLALTGIDTMAGSEARWNEIVIGQVRTDSNVTLAYSYDDLYIADTDASSDATNVIADFTGDVRITWSPPTVDDVADWDPSTGTDHYAMVDETAPDDDTTYNSTATANDVDTFEVQDANVVGANVLAVQVIYSRKRTESGATTTGAVWRVGGTNYVKGTTGDASTYTYNFGIWTLNPATAVAITDTAYNATTVGYKKVS